jgi:hypothetical protein
MSIVVWQPGVTHRTSRSLSVLHTIADAANVVERINFAGEGECNASTISKKILKISMEALLAQMAKTQYYFLEDSVAPVHALLTFSIIAWSLRKTLVV